MILIVEFITTDLDHVLCFFSWELDVRIDCFFDGLLCNVWIFEFGDFRFSISLTFVVRFS